MRLRIRPLPFFAYVSISAILATVSGLAGFLSAFAAALLPTFFVVSVSHLFFSWNRFAFHQEFSNDHPQKGETVLFSVSMENDSFLPAAEGTCAFANPGAATHLDASAPTPTRPRENGRYATEIRCSWRGTYVIGLTAISFEDATGIVSIEQSVEPRVFYVYPELLTLPEGVDRLARASGSDTPVSFSTESDLSIFEYVAPIMPGKPARHIAWKRWAATGIPAETVHGHALSRSLRIVLDLWPTEEGGTERLCAEDTAMSAAFSVARRLVGEEIPVELVYGSARSGIGIFSERDFSEAFAKTTSVIFDDPKFPEAAFKGDDAALLITTRPLVGTRGEKDLYTAYEEAVNGGRVPHMLLCPPPRRAEVDKRALESLQALKLSLAAPGSLALADSRNGMEDIVRAFAP